MKSKLFFSLFAAVLMTVAVSCNKNEYDYTFTSHLDFRSAGYYNYENQGYEFVFTCDKLDISSEILSEPLGGWLEVMVPKECMGKKTPLNENLDTYELGFFIWDNHGNYQNGNSFSSGYIYVDLDESKRKINFEIDGITLSDYHLYAKYQGSISRSDEYIHAWPN